MWAPGVYKCAQSAVASFTTCLLQQLVCHCRSQLRRDTPSAGMPKDAEEFWDLFRMAAAKLVTPAPGAGLRQNSVTMQPNTAPGKALLLIHTVCLAACLRA